MIGQILAILGASLAYTVIRYHVLGPEPAEYIPAFLLNKAVSISSVIFLFVASVAHRQGRPDRLRDWGTAALHAGYVHILLSIALLSESYHPIFYEGERLSFRGEAAIAFGTLAAYGFWLIRRNRHNESFKRILQTLTALVVAVHLVFLGSSGWTAVGSWHGSLPPISLLSFLTVLAAAILFWLPVHHENSETNP